MLFKEKYKNRDTTLVFPSLNEWTCQIFKMTNYFYQVTVLENHHIKKIPPLEWYFDSIIQFLTFDIQHQYVFECI